MKKELKPNDPVMWGRKEYKFIKFIEGDKALIQMDCEKWQREVLLKELDLIIEFDFVK